MKQSTKFLILALALAVLIPLAVLGYNRLSEDYSPSEPQPNSQADNSSGSSSKVTNTAPDFTVTDINGESISLSDYSGKPIVINFWATWCNPCRSELPAFDSAYKQYGEDVTFMMVNLTDGYRETMPGVADFIAENGYSFPVYYDTDYHGSQAYSVSSIPLTVLIDKDGNVYKSHVGAMDETTLTNYINSLIGG